MSQWHNLSGPKVGVLFCSWLKIIIGITWKPHAVPETVVMGQGSKECAALFLAHFALASRERSWTSPPSVLASPCQSGKWQPQITCLISERSELNSVSYSLRSRTIWCCSFCMLAFVWHIWKNFFSRVFPRTLRLWPQKIQWHFKGHNS